MADALEVEDLDHYWGGDLSLSPTGDLARVSGSRRSEQRVLRRLLTNIGDYLAHLDYGGNVPAAVGSLLDIPALTALIRGQMLLEASVARSPEPTVTLTEITNGVSVGIKYFVQPGLLPAALSFDVDR